jgi:membrane-associated phospholipid phosphatase
MKSRMSRPWLVPVFFVIILFPLTVLSQTPGNNPQPDPTPSPTPASNLERDFIRNIVRDQRGLWTYPFKHHEGSAKWEVPLLLSTAALLATDRRTAGELYGDGYSQHAVNVSLNVSRLGSTYATGGLTIGLYVAGRATRNARLRETGLLGAEALIDEGIITEALKGVTQRPRPRVDNASGEFFDGGNSFPSGHSASAWALATVIASEYGHHRPVVRFGVYGLATAVSLSRYTGRAHFLSESLVGSALGYGVGRYVYLHHHDRSLDAETDQTFVPPSKLFPRITPLYSPRAQVYGAALSWSF